MPCTHVGAGTVPSPCHASTARSNEESASSNIPKEKSCSDSDPVEISDVTPARTLLTERPRSAMPLMKKATPDSPLEALKSGISRLGPESEPVGI